MEKRMPSHEMNDYLVCYCNNLTNYNIKSDYRTNLKDFKVLYFVYFYYSIKDENIFWVVKVE